MSNTRKKLNETSSSRSKSSNLPIEFQKILNEVPVEKRESVLEVLYSVKIEKTHKGPLPSPKTLGEYNQIIKNGAERIMAMAENQSNHRMSVEKEAIQKQLNQEIPFTFRSFIPYCISTL